MDLFVLNDSLETIMLLDRYKSVIWTERYSKVGDFQLEISYDKELYDIMTDGDGLRDNLYLRIKDSATLMVIESIELTADPDGTEMVIKGRSLESLLDRRIIYDQLVFTKESEEEVVDPETGVSTPTIVTKDTVAQAIKKAIMDNAISPSTAGRALPRITYADPQLTPEMQKGLSAQYFGDNLLDVLVDICQTHDLGLKADLTAAGNFEVTIYEGLDRSAEQTDRMRIIFSPKFDNLLSSSYTESAASCKTIAVVFGEGSSAPDRVKVETIPEKAAYATGMLRRELYVDASGISKKVTEAGITWSMSDAEYAKELQNKGAEELKKNKYVKEIDGEIDPHTIYTFGTDYFLGDIVQVENEYGMRTKTRVMEYIRSYNGEGYSEYPTFEKVEEKEEPNEL